jgi:prepilin-type processing-associated H-X9-DG protein
VIVVLGIISLLTALLLPAVQKVRASACKAGCQAHLRDLAMAVHQYSDANGHFPVGCDYPFAKNGESSLRQVGISWHTSILPFLEQDPLWREAWEANSIDPGGNTAEHLAARAHVVAEFLCPAEPRTMARTYRGEPWGLTDYVGVAGTGVHKNDGVFHPALIVRWADITDGTTNTLIIGERPASPNGQLSGWYSSWGQSPCALSQVLAAGPNNIILTGAHDCPSDQSPLRPGREGGLCDQGHFWSLHPGGANFAFADGSVRLISYSRAAILPAASTRAGGELDSES